MAYAPTTLTLNHGVTTLDAAQPRLVPNAQGFIEAIVRRLFLPGVVSSELFEIQRAWQHPSASTVRVAAEQIAVVERLFVIDFQVPVQRFLEKHAGLSPLLLEAYGRLQSYFPEAPLHLDVVSDPESGKDMEGIETQQLVLSIVTNFGVTEAMDRLDNFDRDWWLSVLPRCYGTLIVTLEFQ